MEVSSFVSTAGTAGVGYAALKEAVKKLFEYGGNGALMNKWFPNARVYGYFQYYQERRYNGCQARNINRHLFMSVANKPGSLRYFSDGAWFYTSRECVDLY